MGRNRELEKVRLFGHSPVERREHVNAVGNGE
jgi:hypothetical protein